MAVTQTGAPSAPPTAPEVERGKGPMTEAERQEVLRMHQQGLSAREIARRLGRSPSTISRILREAGVAVARPGAAPARKMVTPLRRPPARRAAAPAAVPGVSRQEFRGLEQRVARIERSLARLAGMVPTRPAARAKETRARPSRRRTA